MRSGGGIGRRLAACLLLLAAALPCHAEQLQILTDDSPPVTSSRGGVPSGWAVDVVKEIERRVGETAEIKLMPWARAYHVALREPNVALFATMWTDERDAKFDWVGPLQVLHLGFYGRPGDGQTIRTLDEARAVKLIGVTRTFAVDEELTRLGFANLDRVERPSQMIEKLLSGRNQLIASDDGFVAPEVLDRLGVPADAIERKFEFKTVKTYIAFSKGTPPGIVEAWRKAFAEMRADGTLARLQGRQE